MRAPTPRVLYVHDDLTGAVATDHGADSEAGRLVERLFAVLRGDTPRVMVLTLDEQIARLQATGPRAPFAVAIGIGAAGERVAHQVNARTGWFPIVRRVEVTRIEDGAGGYTLATPTGEALGAQVRGVEAAAALAVVDDTVFSGLTMAAVLRALPAGVLGRTHAFCLRAAAESLPPLARLCPITAGVAAPGRLLEDVSFINASGLVRRGSIRRAGRPPLAFFERPQWIRAWFPRDGDEVLALCRRLHALLEGEPHAARP